MVLVSLGTTRCAICGNALQNGDDTVTIAPFVANRLDPLHRFSDSASHRKCLQRDPLALRAFQRSEETMRRGGPTQRTCHVCGERIAMPDDYFGVGFLTDDKAEPAHDFNYLQFHRSHFHRWEQAVAFRRCIEALQASERWQGPTVQFDPSPSWLPEERLRRGSVSGREGR